MFVTKSKSTPPASESLTPEKEEEITTPEVTVCFGDCKEKLSWDVSGHYDLAPLDSLLEQIKDIITRSGVGKIRVWEVAFEKDEGVISIVGPSADIIFRLIFGVLRGNPLTRDGTCCLKDASSDSSAPRKRCIKIGDR